jgi:hypothetical protein
MRVALAIFLINIFTPPGHADMYYHLENPYNKVVFDDLSPPVQIRDCLYSAACATTLFQISPAGMLVNVRCHNPSYRDSPECPSRDLGRQVTCSSVEDAIIKLKSLYGGLRLSNTGDGFQPNGVGQTSCPADDRKSYFLFSGLRGEGESPISCNADNLDLEMVGRLGETVSAHALLHLRCDGPATVRLTLSEKGIVRIGGGGEVLLTFGDNGSDVLNTSADNPPPRITGKLTKSPGSQGVYLGSSVLRLEIM